MLRISVQTFYKLRNNGLLTPLQRRDGERIPSKGGLKFYSDREIFKAILFLFPDMVAEDVKAFEETLLKVS